MLPRISKVECNDADYLLFSTEDAISNTLFRTGKWEDHLITISDFILKEADSPLLIDIGANLGAYSIPLAKKIQDIGGKVIGFEPQRIIYYQLCGNIILNRLDNFYAEYCAIGDHDGSIDIPEVDYTNLKNIGGFSIEERYRVLQGIQDSVKKTSTKVSLISLDSYDCDTSPTLIKIDVEGHEINVLRGANKFLSKHNFPPILFEAWGYDWFKNDRNLLLSYIEDLGYKITAFGGDYIAQHPTRKNRINFKTLPNGQTLIER